MIKLKELQITLTFFIQTIIEQTDQSEKIFISLIHMKVLSRL